MLTSFKSKAPDKDQNAVTSAPKVMEPPIVPPPRPIMEKPAPRPEPTANAGTISSIGAGMSIVGTIDCNGPAQVFGRIQGELRASDLLIGEGAQVEGDVVAQEVTICGRVKGTIRAVRVKLQGGGAVEGDIIHRSLSIDESALFEGSSRRVENPMEAPSSVEAKGLQKKVVQAQIASVDAALQRP